ncbi:hypothetical protein NW768_008575 [Fusarium equiseti]|uniref:FAD-binding PCMH-type domain-containing protein n=1 Tax=Fusarium equiseti TaxID=61235 RepID=A0ABQ8R4I9_FUSEQ|nr:hypothetical protein NW768_008575 [Fusarium equiseti]
MSTYQYTTTPEYSAKILVKGTPEYDRCRRNNPSAVVPERYPCEIHIVRSPKDVSAALSRARELGVSVGIRGSGHLMSLPGLVDGGILIDTVNLNRHIDYDHKTQVVSFGPSVRMEELGPELERLRRFFPYGHAPTVGAAGFLLAGGLGWFPRGWGATCQNWIQKMEIVAPNGEVVIASPTENQDLWWAARGSGLAFFGVVTRIWCHTIKAAKMWERSLRFEINHNNYETLMLWALERGRDTPKYGTDLALTIDYPEKNDPAFTTDAVPPGANLHMVLNLIAYADTEREAATLLSAYDKLDTVVKQWLLHVQPLQKITYRDVFNRKKMFWGNGKVERWQMNGMFTNPAVPLSRLLEIVKPAMLELRSRASSVFIMFCDVEPDETDAAFSLPAELYISTFSGWSDPALDSAMKEPMLENYKRAFHIGTGMYIADFDVDRNDSNTKVMTDSALAKLLQIREKWDPTGLFPNYMKIVETHERVNKLQNKALL